MIGNGSTTPVGTRTLFQAGSISKPVAAAAALALVEKGKLSLDEDVNQKLKTWKVPRKRIHQRTKGYVASADVAHSRDVGAVDFQDMTWMKRCRHWFRSWMERSPPTRSQFAWTSLPGTKFRYSGGGVTIEQTLMMDVTGKTFPSLMRETLLDKIGMKDSSYEQPLPPTRAALTAFGTYQDGKPVHGSWHIYPEMAAAGLWTTPTDLAKFAIEIAKSKNGKSNKVLSQKTVDEMLTRVLPGGPGLSFSPGLGFFLDEKNPGVFFHQGSDQGFKALLTMNWQTGNGVALMVNSDNGNAINDLVLRAVAREYKWDYQAGDLHMPASSLMSARATWSPTPLFWLKTEKSKASARSSQFQPKHAEWSSANLTLLPGLIDCHTHLLQSYYNQLGDGPNIVLTTTSGTPQRTLLGAFNARGMLEAGFTAVRDLGNSGVECRHCIA